MNEHNQFLDEVAVACFWFVPFLIALAILFFVQPTTAAQFEYADPLIHIFGPGAGPIVTIVLGLSICGFWLYWRRPDRANLVRDFRWAVAGLLLANGILILIRLIQGPVIPSFIPPEESAGSGLVFGLSAGMLEEVVFRLAVLPPLFLMLRKKMPEFATVIFSSFVVGLLFALSHEIGVPGFEPRYFMTRLVMPGMVMSLVFLKLSPTFLVSAHSGAHIGIAMLFQAGKVP